MNQLIDPKKFGVSFSLKQCRNFGLDPKETLEWLIDQSFRRFRLMSYWNEHEKEQGAFDFTELDKQIDFVEKAGCIVTLCLGARQPRWPENHWPDWAWELTKVERTKYLLEYIQKVVERYRDRDCIVSYQLENEALLAGFGERPEIDRERLKTEYKMISRLDPNKPAVMTTSTSWGIPLRQPIPDIVGFSFYYIVYDKGAYHRSIYQPWIFRFRAFWIKVLWHKPTFIHELQAEPWGPKAIWEMDITEQDKSMSPEQLSKNIQLAKATTLYPIDLWGGEWWYWRFLNGDTQPIDQVVEALVT